MKFILTEEEYFELKDGADFKKEVITILKDYEDDFESGVFDGVDERTMFGIVQDVLKKIRGAM